jgi:hypothetical protein
MFMAALNRPAGGYTKNYEGKRVTGVALSDTWLLKVPPIGEDGSCDFKKFKWEKRKNPGNPPNPVRSGAYPPRTRPLNAPLLLTMM